MKRKVKDIFLKRADGWCKSVKMLYFRLGVVDEESNGFNR